MNYFILGQRFCQHPLSVEARIVNRIGLLACVQPIEIDIYPLLHVLVLKVFFLILHILDYLLGSFLDGHLGVVALEMVLDV